LLQGCIKWCQACWKIVGDPGLLRPFVKGYLLLIKQIAKGFNGGDAFKGGKAENTFLKECRVKGEFFIECRWWI